jgi:coenzyme PQQ precursor peptide PqqA
MQVGAAIGGAASDSDDSATNERAIPANFQSQLMEKTMWSKPEYTEMRFGFEVTMYIANR